MMSWLTVDAICQTSSSKVGGLITFHSFRCPPPLTWLPQHPSLLLASAVLLRSNRRQHPSPLSTVTVAFADVWGVCDSINDSFSGTPDTQSFLLLISSFQWSSLYFSCVVPCWQLRCHKRCRQTYIVQDI